MKRKVMKVIQVSHSLSKEEPDHFHHLNRLL
jgi:hypothetical protein